MKRILPALLLGTSLVAGAAPKGPPPVLSVNGDGKLVYDKDEHGNRVPDFSSCGYAGGDKEIPTVPICVVVTPIKGDETKRIQKAIDYATSLPVDSNGVRGAVLLLKGRHEVLGGLRITNSGVVLRGEGIGEDGTILVATGTSRRTLITLRGRDDRAAHANDGWQISDSYVPVGAEHFNLKDAGVLKVGDAVLIGRPSSKKWIEALSAMDFGGGEGGGWKPGSRDLVWDRVITSIDGNRVGIDAPITTSIDTNFSNGEVKTYSWPGRIRNVGLENLRLESTFDPSNPRMRIIRGWRSRWRTCRTRGCGRSRLSTLRVQQWLFTKAVKASLWKIACLSLRFRKKAVTVATLSLRWANRPCSCVVLPSMDGMIFRSAIAPRGRMHLFSARRVKRSMTAVDLKAGLLAHFSTTCASMATPSHSVFGRAITRE